MKHTRAFTPYKPSAQMLERVKVRVRLRVVRVTGKG